jgi:hypothetical protein
MFVLLKVINIIKCKKTVDLSTVFSNEFYYLFGIFFRISNKKFQNFSVEEMLALSSGEWAPKIVGPKETMSIFG